MINFKTLATLVSVTTLSLALSACSGDNSEPEDTTSDAAAEMSD